MSEDKATRHNSGKAKWSLVNFESLLPMVNVLEFGAKKYSPDNWKKGFDKKELLDSMMRHITALIDGESHDKESGLHHIGHIMCNSMFYSYHFATEESIAKEQYHVVLEALPYSIMTDSDGIENGIIQGVTAEEQQIRFTTIGEKGKTYILNVKRAIVLGLYEENKEMESATHRFFT